MSEVTKHFADADDQAMALPIDTPLADEPIITFTPTAQRTSGSSLAGWTYRRVYSILNQSGWPLVNHPYAIEFGDAAATVAAGRAKANGDDVRVIRDGAEVPRVLGGWNTANALVWFNVPFLPDGESMTVEVWYGNASAAEPEYGAQSGDIRDMPLAGDASNLEWSYPIDTAGAGGWKLSSAVQVPIADTDVPGAWRWITTLNNAVDDAWQDKYTIGDSGQYEAKFSAIRARGASVPAQPQYVQGDAVYLFHPAGITSVRAGLKYLNQYERTALGNPVGRVVLLASHDAQTWTVVEEWNTLQETLTTIAAADYAISPASPYVAFAVWPYDGERIPAVATAGRMVYGAWDGELSVTVQSGKITQALTSAEEEIYEVATEYRLGGDAALLAPYKAVRVGGAPSRRLAIGLGENLVIDLGTRRAAIWNAAQTSKLADASVRAFAGVERLSESAQESYAARWLDIAPYRNQLPNAELSGNADGWSRLTTGTGVVASAPAWSSGRLLSEITASGLVAPAVALQEVADIYLPVAGRSRITLGADVETSNTALVPRLTIWFYDANKNLIGDPVMAELWTPDAGEPVRRVHSAAAPRKAAYYRVGVTVYATSSSAAGNVYTDNVTPNGLDLIVTEESAGEFDVTVEWIGQYA